MADVRAVLPDMNVDFTKNCPFWHFLTKFLAKKLLSTDLEPKMKLMMTKHLLLMDGTESLR